MTTEPIPPKPAHLGPTYAAQFGDAAIVAAYPARPPYPAAVFTMLAALLVEPRVVLDCGCGTGDLARRLAPLVERVDAVDLSGAMIAAGRRLPGGDAPGLRWQVSALEDAALDPPYGLAVAGESIHWMDWPRALPRIASALAPGARLAIIERAEEVAPWTDALLRLIPRYSTNREFQPYDTVSELASRGVFRLEGALKAQAEVSRQTISAYIESIHSRNGFSRDRMPPQDAAAFDEAVAALVAPYAREGLLDVWTSAQIRWGAPLGEQAVG